jgi:iron complex transport system ATP-binding protein
MLTLENVSLSFKNVTMLKNISVSFSNGQIVGIVGGEGAGKTSLLQLIAGNITSYEGKIIHTIHEDSISSSSKRKKHCSYCPSFQRYDMEDTVQNFLTLSRFSLKNFFSPLSEIDTQTINQLLCSFNLEKIKDRPLFTLSAAPRKRVALAFSFAQKSPILLLDNPTNDLDLQSTKILHKEILKYVINEDRILLIASHDLNFIAQTADRIILLDKGTLIKDGGLEILEQNVIKKYFNCQVTLSQNKLNNKPEIHFAPEHS